MNIFLAVTRTSACLCVDACPTNRVGNCHITVVYKLNRPQAVNSNFGTRPPGELPTLTLNEPPNFKSGAHLPEMNVRIFESPQLECSYVGYSLYFAKTRKKLHQPKPAATFTSYLNAYNMTCSYIIRERIKHNK